MEQFMSLKILIIDDQPKYYASFIKYLAGFDFIVETVSCVQDALKLLENDDYGLLMIDVHFREMNGYELAGSIKSQKTSKDLPVIFLSDTPEPKDSVIAGLQIGGVDFITRPFDIITLMLKIRNYLMFSYAMKMLVKNNIELKRLNNLLEENINYSNSLNKLLSQEKRKSDELLLNILPAEVADELKHTGKSPAQHFDNVTVIFADFVNFTKAGEQFSPQELVDELDTCFKAFDEIASKYNVEKIKTIGDCYMAASGLPAPYPDHAVSAVKTAIEILEFIEHRKQQFGDRVFEIRIGIHSGDNVVAGIVGSKKFAYDIWGDTVNIASRLEHAGETGRINISQATYELVNEQFTCIPRGEIEAKNKGKMHMYFVDTRM